MRLLSGSLRLCHRYERKPIAECMSRTMIRALTGRYSVRRTSCNHRHTAPPSTGGYAMQGQCPMWARRTMPGMQTAYPGICLCTQLRTKDWIMRSDIRVIPRDGVYEDDLVDWVIEESWCCPAKVVHLGCEGALAHNLQHNGPYQTSYIPRVAVQRCAPRRRGLSRTGGHPYTRSESCLTCGRHISVPQSPAIRYKGGERTCV